MLGKLFGSTSRVKILKLFISHPEKQFYIRQIARDLKLQINSVRRELDNLEKFGLLLSSLSSGIDNKANSEDDNKEKKQKSGDISSKIEKKFYRVNTEFVLFEEIKALVIKAQVLYERNFVDKIQSAGHLKLLILAGFFVNQEDRSVDLLIVGRINKIKLLKLVKELEQELGREINYTFLSLSEFKYRRDITDVFLYEILEGKNIVIVDELGLA